MPTLPAVMVTLLLPFEHLFDPRTWRKAQLLAMGAILSPGKRTVSSALNILGIGQHGDFAIYHHVLNRARWSPLQLSRALLLLEAGRLGSSTEPLVFGIDETVERRWGRKIAAKGRYRDPVRSKDDQVVMTPGLQWVSLMLLTRIGWAGRHWALPFLTALVVSARYDRRKGRRHQTFTGLRPADAGLPAPVAAGPGPGGGGRWRLRQARVPAALPEYVKADCRRHQTAQGRVPVPARATAAARPDRAAPGGRRAIAQSHGGAGRSRYTMDPLPRHRFRRQYRHGRARFGRGAVVPRRAAAGSHTLGRRQIPGGAPRAYALLCTDTEAEPLRILQWYLLRWQVEVTFEEPRAHLGMETQRQWSERAIARTTPALFGLFSVVTLAADILIEQRGGMAPRTAAWYDKTSPSFADAIALVRRHLWVQQGTFMPSEREQESIKVPRLLYHRMLDTLAYAA